MVNFLTRKIFLVTKNIFLVNFVTKKFFLVNHYKFLKLTVLKFIEAKNLFFPTHVGTLIRLGKLRLSPLVCTHAIFSKIVVCLLRWHHFLAYICVFLAKTGNSFDVCSFLWGHLVVQGCFDRDFFRLTEVVQSEKNPVLPIKPLNKIRSPI